MPGLGVVPYHPQGSLHTGEHAGQYNRGHGQESGHSSLTPPYPVGSPPIILHPSPSLADQPSIHVGRITRISLSPFTWGDSLNAAVPVFSGRSECRLAKRQLGRKPTTTHPARESKATPFDSEGPMQPHSEVDNLYPVAFSNL